MKILIAEDDLVSRKLLDTTLKKWGYEVHAFPDGTSAWECVQKGDFPQLMILDWMMPGLDGVELCSKIRNLELTEYPYIILLTARVQKEDVVEGLEAGADDYITKPFDKQELQVRLRAGRRIIDLQEQLLQVQEKLRDQASHDPLTGLLNRGAIEESLENEISRCRRNDEKLTVIMLDLDHFKNINDTLGHIAGDSVLRQVAKRMTRTVRSYDSVGRYGGEEFLLIFPDCDKETGALLAERIREKIESKKIDSSEGFIDVTASLGVATVDNTFEYKKDDLIQAADEALFEAKDNGRNRVVQSSKYC